MSEGNGLPAAGVMFRRGSVGELGEFVNGFAFRPEDWGEEGLPIIRIQNLTDADKPLNRTQRSVPEKYLVQHGDLLVSWSATLDAFIWDREPSLLNQHIFKVVIDPAVADARFAYYLLKFAIDQLCRTEHLHGSTMKHINRRPFLSHPVPIPSLPVQRGMASILDELFSDLDAGVANLERAKANLKRCRASVLKSAVEGRLTEEWRKANPQSETGKQLLERILRERRSNWEREQLAAFKAKGKSPPKDWKDRYEDPEERLGGMTIVPSSWTSLPLKELASEMCLGKMLDKTKTAGTLRDYLGNIHVRWFSFDLTDLKQMAFRESEIERFTLRKGDLVVCEGGAPGRCAVWNGEVEGMMFQKALHRIRFDPNLYLSKFAMYFICYGTTGNRFAEHYTGTTIRHLTGDALREVVFPVPPLPEQEQIVALVEERLSQIDFAEKAIEQGLERAKRLRQSILKRAFEGRLVPQDPNDEPASVLLERIKASSVEKAPKKKVGRKTTKAKAR